MIPPLSLGKAKQIQKSSDVRVHAHLEETLKSMARTAFSLANHGYPLQAIELYDMTAKIVGWLDVIGDSDINNT